MPNYTENNRQYLLWLAQSVEKGLASKHAQDVILDLLERGGLEAIAAMLRGLANAGTPAQGCAFLHVEPSAN